MAMAVPVMTRPPDPITVAMVVVPVLDLLNTLAARLRLQGWQGTDCSGACGAGKSEHRDTGHDVQKTIRFHGFTPDGLDAVCG